MAVEYPLSERQYERALLDSATARETQLSSFPLGLGRLLYRLDMQFRQEGQYSYSREEILKFFGKSSPELTALGKRLCRIVRTKIDENLPVDLNELFSGICSASRFVEIMQDDKNIFHILNYYHSNYVSEDDVKDSALTTMQRFLDESDYTSPKTATAALSIHKYFHEKKYGGVVQRNLNIVAKTDSVPTNFVPMSDKEEALRVMDEQLKNIQHDSTKAAIAGLGTVIEAEVVK